MVPHLCGFQYSMWQSEVFAGWEALKKREGEGRQKGGGREGRREGGGKVEGRGKGR